LLREAWWRWEAPRQESDTELVEEIDDEVGQVRAVVHGAAGLPEVRYSKSALAAMRALSKRSRTIVKRRPVQRFRAVQQHRARLVVAHVDMARSPP
jgi:hypothetical protein